MAAEDDPRFIVGNDRSGTTMLRLILDRGPDLAIPPESMFLTDFDEVFEAGGPRPGEEQALMRAVWDHPKVALWELEGPPPAVPPVRRPARQAALGRQDAPLRPPPRPPAPRLAPRPLRRARTRRPRRRALAAA